MKLDYGKLNPAIETLFIQEMLKRGYLAATSVYISYAHTEKIINRYLSDVDEVFKILSNSIKNETIHEKLETRIKEQGFKRLN